MSAVTDEFVGVNVPSPIKGTALKRLARTFKYKTSTDLIEALLARPPKVVGGKAQKYPYEILILLPRVIWGGFNAWAAQRGLGARDAAGLVLSMWVQKADRQRAKCLLRSP